MEIKAPTPQILTLRISPCPNDTFIFHAMIHGLVDCEGLCFEVDFQDIETLNSMAIAGQTDVIKASVAVARQIGYTMLRSGGAMGYGNGPIVVRRAERGEGEILNSKLLIANCKVAIAGENTTAALLFRRYFPDYTNLVAMPFNEIAHAVLSRQVDMGVLIHEGRFTYADLGLAKVADLGQLWQEQMDMPIPLGAIFAHNSLPIETIKKVERTIARSTQYALDNGQASADFVRSHAQELSVEVLRNHIDYFVNDFTLDLGERGVEAIATLLGSTAQRK